MSDIHHLPSIEQAEREASEWIARLQADDATDQDRVRFEAWRRAHPRHARAYDELMTTWRQFAASGRTVRAVSFGNAMQAATQVRRRRGLIATAAAMLATVAAVGWWYADSQPLTLATRVGEHASMALTDGSRLELNSDSAVRVAYSEGARIIRLDRGEAFFTVAHETQRPFWVVADRTWIRAVGTAFNVYQRADGVRVTVSEGQVKVAAAAGRREPPSDAAIAQAAASLLGAGQQADARGARIEVRELLPPEISREISWRHGTVYFENQPLYEVVDEIGRYTPLHIELGPEARDIMIGGTFQTNPQGADVLLSMLQDGLGLQVRHEDKQRVYVE